MRELKLKARAKINLGLDVVRKREDGYHEVRMIMQMINLDNLVYRAAKLLMDEFQVDGGLEIELQKYIPVAAGMAGGSTDAAAVMVGVNRIFQLGLNKKQLMERGVKIGADVPFCIMRGTALAEGIGEELTPLPAMPHCSLVIAKPKIHVSTKFVYGNLKVRELTEHPDIDGQVQALRENDLEQLVARMGNVLETVTIPAYPVIDEIKHTMMKYGAMGAMMSGSGPTVFGIFEKEDKAQEVCRLLKKDKAAKQVYLVRQ